MQRRRLRLSCEWMREQQGITLVEVLVALALTVTVVSVVTSILLTTLLSHRRLLQQTDDYESLRIAAATFMQDARYAMSCGGNQFHLELYFPESERVEYKFEQQMPDGTAQADPNHLHRWVYRGADVHSVDIIGWNLVPPSPDDPLHGTRFGCNTSPYEPKATITLVKPSLPGEVTPTKLRVFSYHRS